MTHDAGQEPVTLTRRQLDDLLARVAAVEGRLAPPPIAPPRPEAAGTMGRRRALLGLAGAAAATGAAAVVGAAPAAAAGLAFHLLPTPVRVYDSRPGGAPLSVGPKAPLPGGYDVRTLDLKANDSGVPIGAAGVVLTVLLTNARAGNGNLTIWARDEPKPMANTLVWGGEAGRHTTLALTAVDNQARVKIDSSLATHVILDVLGYYT